MKPELQKIFRKLSEQKIQKVELNIVADIQKFVDEVFSEIEYSEQINKAMDSAWVKAKNAIEDLTKATEEVKSHLNSLDVKADAKSIKEKVKSAAEAIGVNPSAVKGYDEIDVAVKEADKQLQSAKINIRDSKVPKA